MAGVADRCGRSDGTPSFDIAWCLPVNRSSADKTGVYTFTLNDVLRGVHCFFCVMIALHCHYHLPSGQADCDSILKLHLHQNRG